jgi:hypothetical protein
MPCAGLAASCPVLIRFGERHLAATPAGAALSRMALASFSTASLSHLLPRQLRPALPSLLHPSSRALREVPWQLLLHCPRLWHPASPYRVHPWTCTSCIHAVVRPCRQKNSRPGLPVAGWRVTSQVTVSGPPTDEVSFRAVKPPRES